MEASSLLKKLTRSKPLRRVTTPSALPLPVELILMVIKHLETGDMCSAIQTCHAMRRIIETCLYTNVIIPWSALDRLMNLFRTLDTRPDLASNIITFDGSFYACMDYFMTPSRTRQWRRKWLMKRDKRTQSSAKETLLHHMVNVKSLTLRGFGWPRTPSQALLTGVMSLTSLKALIIIENYESYYPYTTPNFGTLGNHVIHHHQLLECLEFRSGGWCLERRIQQSDGPRISHLIDRPHKAGVMVYGGPVAALLIKSEGLSPNPYRWDVWKLLAAEVAPIIALTLDAPEREPFESILGLAAQYLKDIQTLVIKKVLFQEVHSLTGRLPSFCCLHTLRFIVPDLLVGGMGRKMSEEQRIDATTDIRSRCPQFRNLEIEQS
ncbi:hypothetical protein FRB93_006267 [Tulasnella sp. JGI-2019a]|nr:hypothetical protein FRB93_006267 [Tulasnella sp. JGI-2019a]